MKRWIDFFLFLSVLIIAPVASYTSTTLTRIFEFSLGILLMLIAGRRFWMAGVREAKEQDRVWYRFALWLFIWCVAGGFRFLEVMLNQPGYGVVSDYFWIAGYVPLMSAAYLWSVSHEYSVRVRNLLLLAPFAAGLLFLLLEPLLRDPSRSALFKTLDLVYASMDLSAIAMLTPLAVKKKEPAARILLAGLILLFSSDIGFSYSEGHPELQIGYFLRISFVLSYFLFAFAAGTQLRRTNPRESSSAVHA